MNYKRPGMNAVNKRPGKNAWEQMLGSESTRNQCQGYDGWEQALRTHDD